jgi:SAM-dependent methyltransferase
MGRSVLSRCRASIRSLTRGWRKAPYTFLRGAGRVLELAGRASTYLAIGTLRLDDLRGAIAHSWGELGPADDDLSSLMPWEHGLYTRFLKTTDRILLVGSGAGRDLVGLLKLGYRVEGLEVASRAVARSRRLLERERLTAELHTGAIEVVELPGSFDAFIFSWCCYSYIPQVATRVRVLCKVKAQLNPGGRVLISYMPAERPSRLLANRLARFAGRITRSDWRSEPGDVVVASADWRGIHYEHRFSASDFEEEARAAGLRVVFHERGEVGAAVLMV